mgnify:CR=1 FL=1
MGQRLDVTMQNGAVTAHTHRIIVFLHLRPHFQQLGRDGLEMLGGNTAHHHIAAGRHRRRHIGARLDLIGNYGIGGAI